MSQLAVAVSQVIKCHIRLVAMLLDNVSLENLQHKKLYWTMQAWKNERLF